jgi:hypothetical protein
VDVDDSMSECFRVYFSFLISSVSCVSNATFLAVENMGFDWEQSRRALLVRGRGPLERIDVVLCASLYGTTAGRESVVDVEVADEAVDGTSKIVEDDAWSQAEGSVDMDNEDNAGLCDRPPGVFSSSSCALLNVFLIVGEVAESVSSLRLVAFLPKVAGKDDVLSDSLGRLDGEGAPSTGTELYAIGADGRIARDIVLVVVEGVACRLEFVAGDCGIRASMISRTRCCAHRDRLM